MPLYMDVHTSTAPSASTTWPRPTWPTCRSRASTTCSYLRYWVDEEQGRSLPRRVALARRAKTVHREAHGLVAEEVYEVQEGS